MPEVWKWWPVSIGEALEFATDVRQARDGEWRDSLKDATQFLTLGHQMQHARAEAMIEAVRKNATGLWLVPEWPNATVVTATLAAAATVLPVAVPAAYRVGQAVFIGTGPDAWEQRTVASLGGSTITLTAGLAAAYSGSKERPAIIAPLVLCIAPNGLEFQTYFPSQSLGFRFQSVDPVDLAANPYPVHDDVPVITDGRVPFQPLVGAMSQAVDLMASGFGAYEVQEVESYPRRRGTVSWYTKGHSARWALRGFLHYLRGRDGEFWLPSGQNDLPLIDPVSAGALAITVRPVAADGDMIGRRIVLREGGSLVIREVTGATTAGAEQELSIAAPGVAFTTAATVSLATRSRLDTDALELAYIFAAGGLAATCSAPVIEVA